MNNQKTNKFFPTVIAGLGALYAISPIDIIPDFIPFAGWIDDLVVTGGGFLHLGQAFIKDTNKSLSTIIGYIKWGLWILGGILVALVGLLGVAIYNLF